MASRLAKKKIFAAAKGFHARRKNCWTIAVRAVHKAWAYAYRGRKDRARLVRRGWIQRVNAGARAAGMRYSHLIRFLPAAGVALNRSSLAALAATEPYSFRAVVEVALAQRDAEAAAAAAAGAPSVAGGAFSGGLGHAAPGGTGTAAGLPVARDPGFVARAGGAGAPPSGDPPMR
jgi:large subunit ribosomal protein L20